MKILLAVFLFVAAVAALPKQELFRGGRGFNGWISEEGVEEYNRIIGGSEVARNSLPYQVVIYLILVDGRRGLCGGVIITNRHILTAAHCWADGSGLIVETEVHLGAHNLNTPNEAGRVVQRSRDVTVHPQWDTNRIRNDIAIINLGQAIQFTQQIQPVNLPPLSAASQTFAGSSAIASGWGVTSDSAGGVSSVLNQVTLNIITNQVCLQYYSFYIDGSHICSAPVRNGACSGDSGGPLVTQYNGQTTLIGLTSFGSSAGCEANVPSVFARVTTFLQWIALNTQG